MNQSESTTHDNQMGVDNSILPALWPGMSFFTPRHRLQQAFVLRFPTLKPFVDGLQLRMNKLTHIHLRALLRLSQSFGEQAFLAAVTRAQDYRRFDAWAVGRILERHYPLFDEAPLAPLGGAGPIVLGEVEPGSLYDYSRLDGNPASEETENTDDSEENNGT